MSVADSAELERRLLRYVNQDLLPDGSEPVDPTTPLFVGGRLNSLRLLNLLAFVERTVGKEIPDDEIVMDRFETVRRIAEAFGERA